MPPPGFVSQCVSYRQYQIFATSTGDQLLDIYTVGDGLLHTGGPDGCTGFTGLHTGDVEFRVLTYEREPVLLPRGDWDAASETTLWCPGGRVSVIGLMSGGQDDLTDVPIKGRGLIRVRVYARHRLEETVRSDTDPPEQHELHVWPVTEETGTRTLYDDERGDTWQPRPEQAAEWSVYRLPLADADDERVTVVRHRLLPAQVAATLRDRLAVTIPVSDMEIRLTPAGDGELTWQWALAEHPTFPYQMLLVPDQWPSTVHLTLRPQGESTEVTVRHAGVAASHAVSLGLIWGHLLTAAGNGTVSTPPWQARLEAEAAKARRIVDDHRRREEERLAVIWDGSPPSERIRALGYRVSSLVHLDRLLLDRLDALPPDRQREVALWAARSALQLTGLDRVDWIAEAFDAAVAGRPMPTEFSESSGIAAHLRLLKDPQVPHTTIEIDGLPEPVRHQMVAFPVLPLLATTDPLEAAAEVIAVAAMARGPDASRFLAECHARSDPEQAGGR